MVTRRLLIVDDDPRISRMVQRIAEGLEFDTHTVNDPLKFQGVYEEVNPDLIVLDLKMQKVDGIEMLRHLSDQRAQAAIFLMSGVDHRILNSAERLGQSLQLNMCGVISKPFSVAQLREQLLRAPMPLSRTATVEDVALTEAELLTAINREEFFPSYQPKVDLRSQQVVGAEALARWRHHNGQVIYPDRFIPLAERSGLVKPLTYALLSRVLSDMYYWPDYACGLNVAVNLSAKLLDDVNLPDIVSGLLDNADIEPERLTLEVTESWAISPSPKSMDILTRLRLKGISLSIDDLGTGYSSLEHLYSLPYSELKIDRSYINAARTESDARAVVESITQLGCGLGLKIVAEGIEEPSILRWLREVGCEIGQGYYFGRPMESPQFLQWLDSWQRQRA